MDWTKAFECIITLITIILSGVVVPWIKTKYDAGKIAKALQYVEIAVGAAEQLATASGYNGEWKKAYVQDYLSKLGITVDADTLNNMIESAVLQLHNQLNADT